MNIKELIENSYKQNLNNRNKFGVKDSINCYLNINGIHYIQYMDSEGYTPAEFQDAIFKLKCQDIKYVVRTIDKSFKRLYREDK
jgi:hypothetical protein